MAHRTVSAIKPVFLYDEFLRDHFHMISMERLGHGSSVGKIEPSIQAQAASFKSQEHKTLTLKPAIPPAE